MNLIPSALQILWPFNVLAVCLFENIITNGLYLSAQVVGADNKTGLNDLTTLSYSTKYMIQCTKAHIFKNVLNK